MKICLHIRLWWWHSSSSTSFFVVKRGSCALLNDRMHCQSPCLRYALLGPRCRKNNSMFTSINVRTTPTCAITYVDVRLPFSLVLISSWIERTVTTSFPSIASMCTSWTFRKSSYVPCDVGWCRLSMYACDSLSSSEAPGNRELSQVHHASLALSYVVYSNASQVVQQNILHCV